MTQIESKQLARPFLPSEQQKLKRNKIIHVLYTFCLQPKNDAHLWFCECKYRVVEHLLVISWFDCRMNKMVVVLWFLSSNHEIIFQCTFSIFNQFCSMSHTLNLYDVFFGVGGIDWKSQSNILLSFLHNVI